MIKYILKKCPLLYKTPWPNYHGNGIKVDYSHMTPIKLALADDGQIFEIIWKAMYDLNIPLEECFIELLMSVLGPDRTVYGVSTIFEEYHVDILTKYYVCPGNSCILRKRFGFKFTKDFWNIDNYDDDDGSEFCDEEYDEYGSDDKFEEKQLTILELALMIKFHHQNMVTNENL